MSETAFFIICAILGYLLGSVPFGLVLTRLAGYEDIRKVGSKSIGATNVLRITGSKKLTILTILLDAFKAGAAAGIAYMLAPNPFREVFIFVKSTDFMTSQGIAAALLAGTMAVVGHNFPIWLKFKGGKGVASSFGLILVISPNVALYALLTWIFVAFTTRYSSLAAIIAALLTPVYAWFFAGHVYTIFYIPIVVLLIIRHHTNIKRLIKGEESKITFKKKNG